MEIFKIMRLKCMHDSSYEHSNSLGSFIFVHQGCLLVESNPPLKINEIMAIESVKILYLQRLTRIDPEQVPAVGFLHWTDPLTTIEIIGIQVFKTI
eukprot:GHVO01063461.1.p1 GENE.GHVO01063461.1~~GHVO01063461.1.p1  ORF type:complete len:103 (-),score=0.14 GHVO01063461.1:363-650(-)